MAEELLRLEEVSKYYTSAQSVVMGLNSLSLRFCRGEFVAVTGESAMRIAAAAEKAAQREAAAAPAPAAAPVAAPVVEATEEEAPETEAE